MDMSRNDMLLLCFTALVIILVVIKISSESFQRISYTELHDLMENRYDTGDSLTHPLPLPTTIHDHNTLPHLKTSSFPDRRRPRHPLRPQSFQKPSDISFPEYTRGLNVNKSHNYPNNPVLYGYLKSHDDLDNEIYELYELYDYRRGRNGYVYKDSKYENNRESIFVAIDHKSYNGDTLYTGDTITVGYKNKPFVVQEYDYKNRGFGTRYNETDIRDEMDGYGILRPLGAANNHTDVMEEDRFFILYRQELDRHRGTFYYYVKDKRDVVIQLDKTKYKELYEGDLVTIPGKEKYGEYVLSVYNDAW